MTHLSLSAAIELGPLSLALELVSESRTIVIDGPSGAGKSTCLRILAGLERRARGRLVVDDRVLLDTAAGVSVPPWERRVGWVPQESLLFPHRTVRENLAYTSPGEDALADMARTLRIDALLDRLPRNLSGGERQRVALGRALLARPRLLLLDEPFSALDAPLRTEVAASVAAHVERERIGVVLVTHDTASAEVLSGEHWTLSAGALRLRADADPGERRGA